MWVMVQYKVRRDQLDRYRKVHKAVYDALEATGLDSLREATFALDDGVTFVRLMNADSFPVPGTGNLGEFWRFQTVLPHLCEEPVVMTMLQETGSYRFTGEQRAVA